MTRVARVALDSIASVALALLGLAGYGLVLLGAGFVLLLMLQPLAR